MNSTEQPAVAGPVEPTVRPLVERLEDAAHAWENHLTVCGDHMPSPAMLREAKNEIQRLRSAIDNHNAGCVESCAARSHCEAFTSRGRNCPDCPRDWAIEA